MKILFSGCLLLVCFITQAQTGNVGIGITLPQSKLHVRTFSSGGTFHPNATAIFESNTVNFLHLSNSSTNVSGILSGTNLTQQRSGIFFNPDSSLQFTAGGTINNMYLDNTGFLGINKSNPATRLHVSNGASGNTNTSASRIATFEDNISSYIQLLNPSANESGILAGNTETLVKSGIVFTSDSAVQLRTGGNNTRLIIVDTGNVGINNNFPSSKLSVNGSLALPIRIISSSAGTSVDASDHTVIINNSLVSAFTINLPLVTGAQGREYVLVNQNNFSHNTNFAYRDFTNTAVITIPANSSITLQGFGGFWYRVK